MQIAPPTLTEVRAEFARRRMRIAWDQAYPWQRQFIGATRKFHECCEIAANQIGKTYMGALIDAMHLTGDYPKDWPGHRFESAPVCWVLGATMEKCRDLIQTALFGLYRDDGTWEGGLIPAERIQSWESATGTPKAMRTVRVEHVHGTATVQFWSYSQGQHVLMGDVVDHVHVDEEPRDPNIRPQLLTRTINGDRKKGGRMIYTFTPENGRTELVVQFLDTPSTSQYCQTNGWEDAPHITQEKAERLLASYPAHQRDMRTKGTPMLGHGRIYDLADEYITIEPLATIPPHWFVIHGMDFGWDHPQAHVRLYEDRDSDIIYLARSYKARMTSANEAWGTVKHWGPAPTAWPHDGLQHEKGRDVPTQQRDHYAKAGFSMLPTEARWLNADGTPGSLSVEQGILEITERMRTGRFKVFAGQADFFGEFRQYHRDQHGHIVKTNDDILDAVRTAYMMRRCAARVGDVGKPNRVTMPQPIRAVGGGMRR